jgi:hypothetical protein
MAENKTIANDKDVSKFIAGIEDEKKRSDCNSLLSMMAEISGKKATMWGDSIVGFGDYHYKYESGREGDMFIVGFSPRKQAISLYLMAGFNRYPEVMAKLGKYKTGKSCLYIKRLKDINEDALRSLIKSSIDHFKNKKN